ncbi:hypothetical protein HOP52_00080 [Halomonas campisalis]|uniref:Uncharacterized protein n=1 Tax=Billgrantia campisalis TaxID=74661 RepID=A0ABS9P329_9GAMM|nr:hypothetical protein [Halomonas campisalis]MCG6656179.1 hypothetical protein [Halomonas campisalis]MDR5861365.1 hypothetical protein [Halomonas campisalis]
MNKRPNAAKRLQFSSSTIPKPDQEATYLAHIDDELARLPTDMQGIPTLEALADRLDAAGV